MPSFLDNDQTRDALRSEALPALADWLRTPTYATAHSIDLVQLCIGHGKLHCTQFIPRAWHRHDRLHNFGVDARVFDLPLRLRRPIGIVIFTLFGDTITQHSKGNEVADEVIKSTNGLHTASSSRKQLVGGNCHLTMLLRFFGSGGAQYAIRSPNARSLACSSPYMCGFGVTGPLLDTLLSFVPYIPPYPLCVLRPATHVEHRLGGRLMLYAAGLLTPWYRRGSYIGCGAYRGSCGMPWRWKVWGKWWW
ncbi:hypothetical protein QBC40DRAFT_15050 [Triangularia verruculosa]|uniref:Uncharacterized protein n=1 Tax=Triangularia verruculosa TaxID=2587418 RepID=A0AAN7AQR6_9PEZI|nr:hypothetical protein QBC40DRAFT_15050 [Triangularia verruculosa]